MIFGSNTKARNHVPKNFPNNIPKKKIQNLISIKSNPMPLHFIAFGSVKKLHGVLSREK